MGRKPPPKELRASYNACLDLVYQGVPWWDALWFFIHPTPAVVKAERGELPDGWRMLSEEELDETRREEYRTRYQGRKAAA